MSTDQTDFTHRVAVITGGSSGLGLAISKALIEAGAYVAILDLNIHPDLQNHPAVFFQSVDITQEEKVQEAITLIWKNMSALIFL